MIGLIIWTCVAQPLQNHIWNLRLQILGFVANGSASLLTHTGIHISSHISSLSAACCASLSRNCWSRGREVSKGREGQTERERDREREILFTSRVFVRIYRINVACLIRCADECVTVNYVQRREGPLRFCCRHLDFPLEAVTETLVKICPIGNKNFSVSAPSMFDTFFSEDWNEEAACVLVMSLALFEGDVKGLQLHATMWGQFHFAILF